MLTRKHDTTASSSCPYYVERSRLDPGARYVDHPCLDSSSFDQHRAGLHPSYSEYGVTISFSVLN